MLLIDPGSEKSGFTATNDVIPSPAAEGAAVGQTQTKYLCSSLHKSTFMVSCSTLSVNNLMARSETELEVHNSLLCCYLRPYFWSRPQTQRKWWSWYVCCTSPQKKKTDNCRLYCGHGYHLCLLNTTGKGISVYVSLEYFRDILSSNLKRSSLAVFKNRGTWPDCCTFVPFGTNNY